MPQQLEDFSIEESKNFQKHRNVPGNMYHSNHYSPTIVRIVRNLPHYSEVMEQKP